MDKDENKMIKGNEYEMIKRLQSALPDAETMRFNFDKIDLATYLYDAGCRKVGEDEIVVKKSKIGMLEKTIDYLEMEKAQLYKQREQAEQETAREILHKIKEYIDNGLGGYLLIERKDIRELAKALGIELE